MIKTDNFTEHKWLGNPTIPVVVNDANPADSVSAGAVWSDTNGTEPVLKQRNSANNDWIVYQPPTAPVWSVTFGSMSIGLVTPNSASPSSCTVFTFSRRDMTSVWVDPMLADLLSGMARLCITSAAGVRLYAYTSYSLGSDSVDIGVAWQNGKTSDFLEGEQIAVTIMPIGAQANWNEDTSTNASYIQNKPDLGSAALQNDDYFARSADAIAALDYNSSDPPTQSEVQGIIDKINALLTALKS